MQPHQVWQPFQSPQCMRLQEIDWIYSGGDSIAGTKLRLLLQPQMVLLAPVELLEYIIPNR
jgi:hypothetical protein